MQQTYGSRCSGGAIGRRGGSNGPCACVYTLAAPPSQPQGSTVTYLQKAGVSCGTGLRHGVTMHPRGRHSREGVTLLPHRMTQTTAREQQQQQGPHYNHNNWQRTWREEVIEDDGMGPCEKHQDIRSKWCYLKVSFPCETSARGVLLQRRAQSLVNSSVQLGQRQSAIMRYAEVG